MIRVGITGQSGFIGSYLYNYLGLYPDRYERIQFKKEYFEHDEKMTFFVKQCDILFHLAAINRHSSAQVLYDTNVRLSQQLISACENAKVKPHILFSSSTQEDNDNPYGNSKSECRKLLEQWAKRVNAKFTSVAIPNVFGPFGKPYYNSVVATFCYQLTHVEKPIIAIDNEIEFIYVGDLVKYFLRLIEPDISAVQYNCGVQIAVPSFEYVTKIKVSRLLGMLSAYKSLYFDQGIIPSLRESFECNLFNTFVCYIDIEKYYPVVLKMATDERGSFVEVIKLQKGGQVSFSTTKSGITRGNHFHTRKSERFVVVKGKARVEIRRVGTDKVHSFMLNGEYPSYIDMPVWYTHNITNVGDNELLTLFWISEQYDTTDPDTFSEVV